ncbi:unnamed protein product, partial [marine sediment metagenome]
MKCVIAGSFDPITNGHINIINRCCKTFDDVIVAIGINDSKKTLFNGIERLEMIQNVFASSHNIIVMRYTGTLIDFCSKNGIDVIVRGIRNNDDLISEKSLDKYIRQEGNGPEMLTMFPDSEVEDISSTVVKELSKHYLLTTNQVPLIVKMELERKIHDHNIIGVTGMIASGKSYVCKKFKELHPNTEIIDFDDICHNILFDSNYECCKKTKERIIDEFNLIKSTVDSIDKEELKEATFGKRPIDGRAT